jgi:carboxypeptidase PM20D1
VKNKSAVVAVHEKSRHVYKCTSTLSSKGHGGFGPATDNALVRMSEFISEVSKANIYKGRFYPEVKATFTRHAPYMSFPMNVLFGNFGLFGPVIKKIMLGIPQTNAMLSTGITFTSMTAGSKEDPQLRAKTVEANMFLRCVREEDLKQGLEKIKKIASKYGVEIEEVLRDYCEPTDFNDRPYKVLEEILNENFPDVIVTPFLLTAGTDARHFSGLADSILRFAPIDLDQAQFASIHNANEHIKIKNIGECVCFYKDFIKRIK